MIPKIAPLLAPLEDAVLFPALTACSLILRVLISLPCHLGEMAIVKPTDIANSQFNALVHVTASLK